MEVVVGFYRIKLYGDHRMDDGSHHGENEDWQEVNVAPLQCTTVTDKAKFHEKVSMMRPCNNNVVDSRIITSWPQYSKTRRNRECSACTDDDICRKSDDD